MNIDRSWQLAERPANLRVLVSGYHSWSEAELQPLLACQSRPLLNSRVEQAHDPCWPPSGESGCWRSHTMMALVRNDGSGWVGLSMTATDHFVRWEARAETQGVVVRVDAEGQVDRVEFRETADVVVTLEDMARQAGLHMKARRTPAPRVWCSWYAYGQRVTAQRVLDDARAIRRANLPIDVIQLDDGFQQDIGDWEDNRESFGLSLEELANDLRHLGFTPGLWLAPLLVRPSSRLASRHPEWFLQRDGKPALYGDNWGGPYHALDGTRTEVLQWLSELTARVRQWGYPYLKLDFLFAGALPGERADPTQSRAQTYRATLQALRSGAGEDAFILGCGAPLAQSVGLVDAMRTGPDVAPRWDDALRRQTLQDRSGPATRNAVHTCLARWWMHHWFTPDPDVYIARHEQSLLTPDERRVLEGLLDTIGGLKSFSDPMKLVTPEGEAALRRCLQTSLPDRPQRLDLSHDAGTVTRFQRNTYLNLDFPDTASPPRIQPTPIQEVSS